MIRCLLSLSGKKEYQTMVVMAVGFLCMNTTGNMVDGKLFSTRETTIVMHLIDMKMVFTMTLFLP